MKRGCLVGMGIAAFLSLLLLVVPLVIPIPPLRGTVPPEQLADPDSLFVDVNGIAVHYKTAGEGEPVFLLLHGFGASLFSWREVMEPLSRYGQVVAFDRPAFGLTERPMPGECEGESPYSPRAQAALTVALMDALGIPKAILVGNSAGGTVAALVALEHPERVEALVFVDAAIYSGGSPLPSWVKPLLRTPQGDRLGLLVARAFAGRGESLLRLAWHEPDNIPGEVVAGYKKPLRAENWDRALWELTVASGPTGLSERLEELRQPALVITGDDDRIVPAEQSIRLARELPDAILAVIPDCGHVPQEECPVEFMQAVNQFLITLPLAGSPAFAGC